MIHDELDRRFERETSEIEIGLIAAGLMVMVAACASAQNINAAGATFPYPIYNKWFTEYAQAHPEREDQLPVDRIGRRDQAGVRGHGGLRRERWADERRADCGGQGKVMQIPTVLGAVVPVYNLPGVNKELNFSRDVIADIYLGKITKWNDPRIAKDNPGVNLPDKQILPVYRSEGSGTTFIFYGLSCRR